MSAAQGILTATGGMTSHAAVVGRQMGKPAVVGCGALKIDEEKKRFSVGGQTFAEGEWISIDGGTGEVMAGEIKTRPSEILQVVRGEKKAEESTMYQYFSKLLSWADEVQEARRPGQLRHARRRPDGLRLRRAGDRPRPDRAHVLRAGAAAHRQGDDHRR